MIDALVIFERRPALFERDVEPAQLEANAAPIEIRLVVQPIRHRKLVAVGNKRRGARSRAGVAVEGEIRNEPVSRQQVERKVGEAPSRIEGLFVEHDAARKQRIGVGGQEVEVGDIAIVGVEVVELRFSGIEMEGGIGIVAPTVGAHADLIECTMFRIGECELRAQQLRSGAEVYDAAVGVEAAPDTGLQR